MNEIEFDKFLRFQWLRKSLYKTKGTFHHAQGMVLVSRPGPPSLNHYITHVAPFYTEINRSTSETVSSETQRSFPMDSEYLPHT